MWGDRVWSYSILLKWPSGDEEGEEIHPGVQTGNFSCPSVSGNTLKSAARCGSSLSAFAWVGGQAHLPAPMPCALQVGVNRGKKLFGQGSQFDV